MRGRQATKTTALEKLPQILVVHIKRFYFDVGSGLPTKVHKPVAFDAEILLPSRSCKGAAGMQRYRLFAVVCHHGNSAAGGHYTCHGAPATVQLGRAARGDTAGTAAAAAAAAAAVAAAAAACSRAAARGGAQRAIYRSWHADSHQCSFSWRSAAHTGPLAALR